MKFRNTIDVTTTDFSDANYVWNSINYSDTRVVVKLLLRQGEKQTPICHFETGTYAELSEKFQKRRADGWELFMTVGVTDGKGHKRENFRHAWALAIDFDQGIDLAWWERSPFRPSLVIRTSAERYHFVWILTEPLGRDDANALLTAMTARLGGDPAFANVMQAIRLPGFINGKHGTEVELLCWSDRRRTYVADDLRLAFDVGLATRFLRRSQPRFSDHLLLPKVEVDKPTILEDLRSALSYIDPGEYRTWCGVGMALQSLGREGYDLWVEWSRSSKKFDAHEMPKKWEDLSNTSVGPGMIFSLAAKAGWKNPISQRVSTHHVEEHLTERAVGELLAAEMGGEFAALPNDGPSRHAYVLLRWDEEKYIELSDRERRNAVEIFVRRLKERHASSREFCRYLTQKSGSNRALDDLSEHLCESLVEESIARSTFKFPYLPVANGVLNLLSRELVPGVFRPVSASVGRVRYDPTAKAELFRETLGEIFENDDEMIRAVIRLFGYILLGNPKEHVLVVFYGPTGRNGKSLLINVFREIFGSLAHAVPPAVILAKSHNNEGPTPALAVLEGKRLAIFSEPSTKHPLDAGFLKLVTGGEHITARPLHGQLREFLPEFTPVIVANKIPSAPDDDHALWRRIKIIEFCRTFSDEEIDVDLKEKLVREASGILNLLLDGVEDYRTNGLNFPEKVKSASVARRKEFDPFEAWHDACAVEVDAGRRTALKEISASYEAWRKTNPQFRGLGARELSRRLSDRGYEKTTVQRYTYFHGIGLTDGGSL